MLNSQELYVIIQSQIKGRTSYMYQVYQGKKNSIFSSKNLPLEGEYVYFIRIGDERIFKIGTTNDLLRRMKELLRYFKKIIYILWVSPPYSK